MWTIRPSRIGAFQLSLWIRSRIAIAICLVGGLPQRGARSQRWPAGRSRATHWRGRPRARLRVTGDSLGTTCAARRPCRRAGEAQAVVEIGREEPSRALASHTAGHSPNSHSTTTGHAATSHSTTGHAARVRGHSAASHSSTVGHGTGARHPAAGHSRTGLGATAGLGSAAGLPGAALASSRLAVSATSHATLTLASFIFRTLAFAARATLARATLGGKVLTRTFARLVAATAELLLDAGVVVGDTAAVGRVMIPGVARDVGTIEAVVAVDVDVGAPIPPVDAAPDRGTDSNAGREAEHAGRNVAGRIPIE